MEKQVIQSVGFRNIEENGEITGFQLKIRLPYYRGVYLSQIRPGHLIVDGESFGENEIMWRVNGEDYTYADLRANCKEHWHPMEPATLIVKKPGGLKQGFHELTYGFCCTHSYMPPFMEALEDPDKPAVIYFREFGQNTNTPSTPITPASARTASRPCMRSGTSSSASISRTSTLSFNRSIYCRVHTRKIGNKRRMNHMPTQERSDPKLLVSYSLGEVACQMSWYMINTYLMAFYTDVVTLSAGAISMIMLIARVWDTINDPMMGNIADHTQTRWGRFRPYMIFGAPVLAIFNILTFTVFPVTGLLKVVLALVTYVGAGMAYTACSIAYQALQNVIAIDSRVRMNLATARGLGSQIIGVILSLVAMPMILHFSQTMNAEGAKIADAKGYFGSGCALPAARRPTPRSSTPATRRRSASCRASRSSSRTISF